MMCDDVRRKANGSKGCSVANCWIASGFAPRNDDKRVGFGQQHRTSFQPNFLHKTTSVAAK
jgi:hypothetical protein